MRVEAGFDGRRLVGVGLGRVAEDVPYVDERPRLPRHGRPGLQVEAVAHRENLAPALDARRRVKHRHQHGHGVNVQEVFDDGERQVRLGDADGVAADVQVGRLPRAPTLAAAAADLAVEGQVVVLAVDALASTVTIHKVEACFPPERIFVLPEAREVATNQLADGFGKSLATGEGDALEVAGIGCRGGVRRALDLFDEAGCVVPRIVVDGTHHRCSVQDG